MFEIRKSKYGRSSSLYYKEKVIAHCEWGDHEIRHGGLEGWKKLILKRTDKRLSKIKKIMNELEKEQGFLLELKKDL